MQMLEGDEGIKQSIRQEREQIKKANREYKAHGSSSLYHSQLQIPEQTSVCAKDLLARTHQMSKQFDSYMSNSCEDENFNQLGPQNDQKDFDGYDEWVPACSESQRKKSATALVNQSIMDEGLR